MERGLGRGEEEDTRPCVVYAVPHVTMAYIHTHIHTHTSPWDPWSVVPPLVEVLKCRRNNVNRLHGIDTAEPKQWHTHICNTTHHHSHPSSTNHCNFCPPIIPPFTHTIIKPTTLLYPPPKLHHYSPYLQTTPTTRVKLSSELLSD